MTESDSTHDVIVLGGGPGGYGVALRAAVRGLNVAMVEADKVGGTCLHWGCIPSKAMLHVGSVLDEAREADRFGIDLTVAGLDVAKLGAFRESVQTQLYKGLEGLVKSRKIDLVTGWGSVGADGKSVTVSGGERDGEVLRADNVVIAVGSSVRSLPGIEIDGDVVITSDEATKLARVPEKALVIGSGAVGLEFASLFRSLGAEEVVVVEALDRIAPLEDEDLSKSLARAYRKRGITTIAGTVASSVTVSEGPKGKAATVSLANGDAHVVDTVLVAVGRAPRTAGIGLEDLGILDERGYVVADEYGRTAVDGVWAVGDILPPPALALAHAGFAEGFNVADQIAGHTVVPVDYAQVPRVTYCTPEVSSVGLTEAQAVERYGKDAVSSSKYTFKGNAKGIIHQSDGFVKTVVGGPEGAVLGVHIIGPHATDLIAEAQLITAWGALPEEVGALVHPHPTLAEAMGEAHMAAADLPFHTH
ncbi:dihydrolipoyl dehydrogenase [Euzebya rosea]|uniref:dihydrolipoyl dehydrogenase n=1 Tax=Euzebya rosea TaxID=2052804 RepID=UPI000D3E23D0|nr:dihydrolipoyl dehydrogenase [Euzebya rosea]